MDFSVQSTALGFKTDRKLIVTPSAFHWRTGCVKNHSAPFFPPSCSQQLLVVVECYYVERGEIHPQGVPLSMKTKGAILRMGSCSSFAVDGAGRSRNRERSDSIFTFFQNSPRYLLCLTGRDPIMKKIAEFGLKLRGGRRTGYV